MASSPPRAVCPQCGGRGWLVVSDGGAGTARRCTSCRQDARPRLLAAAGVPESYAHCRLANFLVASPDSKEKDQLFQALSLARQYVENFLAPHVEPAPPAMTSPSTPAAALPILAGLPGAPGVKSAFQQRGLLFIGPPGVGKTHLAVGVLVELIEKYRVRGRFVDFTTLLHQIAASFVPSSAESKHEILDPVTEAELLVLDELGSHAQHMVPWVQEVLYLVINQRYQRRLPTLFTTNYRLTPAAVASAQGSGLDRGRDPDPEYGRPEMLASRIPPALVSRLFEMTRPVELTAVSDHRRQWKSVRARHPG